MEKNLFIKKVFNVVVFLVVVLSVSAAVYFYIEMNKLKENPQLLADREVSMLVSKIGRFMVLPTGEVPTVATVVDAEGLKKDQPFFNLAQVGDKVLIYQKAGKAILYNPTSNKIVEVGPLEINKNGSQNSKISPVSSPADSSE